MDLKGHTEGARPGILAHRPCPVQVNWLGYPGTIGADLLDYIIGDPVVLPFDHQPWYSEKIVHLPHCYQCNDHRAHRGGARQPGQRRGLPQDGFVFCCFNAAWKITPAMFDIWMRLLAAVPGSVLWLLDDNDTARRNLRAGGRRRAASIRTGWFSRHAPSRRCIWRATGWPTCFSIPCLTMPTPPPATRYGRACRWSPALAASSMAASRPACS